MSIQLVGRLRTLAQDVLGHRVLARSAAGSFGVKVLAAGIGLLSQLALTNVLGSNAYGVYIYVITWLNFIALVGTFGFQTASVRFVASYRHNEAWGLLRGFRQYSRRVVWLASGIGAVGLSVGAVLLVGPQTSPLYLTLLVATVVLVLLCQLRVHGAELQGWGGVVAALFSQEVLRPALIIAGVIALGWGLGMTVRAPEAMGLNAGATLVALGFTYWQLRRVVPEPVRQNEAVYERKEWLATSRDLMLVAGFTTVLFQVDTLMIGTLVDTDAAGIYAITTRVAALLAFVLVAVNAVLAPRVAGLYAAGRVGELQRLVTLCARVVFAVSLVAAVLLLIWDRDVLALFGETFVTGDDALRLLIVGQLANAWAGPAVLLLNMTEHHRAAMRIMGTSAVLNLVLNAALIPIWGLYGAAVATTTTTVLWNAAAATVVRRRLGISSTAFFVARRPT